MSGPSRLPPPPGTTGAPGAGNGSAGLAIERLRQSLGQPVVYAGIRCTVHDVVDEPPLLVLRPDSGPEAIQGDSYGRATRKAPALIEIPVFGADGVTPSEELARVSLASPQAGR